MEKLHEIAGNLTVQWVPEVRAVLDTWSNYTVSLAAFREAVMDKGLAHARQHRGQAWIVDSSTARGSFPQDIQNFIGSDLFPAFAEAGIKWFITISSASAITKMTISSYTSKLGPSGIQLVEAASAEGAIEWLKKNAG